MLAMADGIEYIPEGTERQYIIDAFQKLMESALQYHREDGYFSWQLPAMEGPKDTSATAMIGYALKKGRNYFNHNGNQEQNSFGKGDKKSTVVEEVIEKIEAALISSCKNGKIYDCSGECHGFSQYPQVYGTYPWSLGPGMRFLGMK